jgi:hypothetical protein
MYYTFKKGENMKWPLITGIFGYVWACISYNPYYTDHLYLYAMDYCKLRLHFLKDIA